MNTTAGSSPNEVRIVDVRMPFWSMVILMVKWAIAAIPALLILSAVAGVVVALFGILFWWSR
jgi:hypothetical protein